MPQTDIHILTELLHQQKASLAIAMGEGDIHLCYGKGVSDLHRLYTTMPKLLDDALVADKVVGKGAAALMILANVKEVYAVVISRPALRLFEESNTPVTYTQLTDNIINRKGDDICPVEKLCINAKTPEDCLPLITNFIQTLKC